MLVDSLASLASLALGIVGRIGPPQAVPNGNIRVQIQVGRNGNHELAAAGGHIPQIELKDTSDRKLGLYDPWKSGISTIESSSAWTFDIPRKLSSELRTLDIKMEYEIPRLSHSWHYGWINPTLRTLNDAICVAHLAWLPELMMFNEAARAGAITGDLWHFCGQWWYLSGRILDGKELRCGWLDGDNTNGKSVYRIKLNTDILANGYFKSYAKEHPNSRDICDFGVKFYPGPSPKRNRKRSTQRDVYGNNAYVTAGASAIELCDSTTSRGPSMLSLQEGIFCDMTTKWKVPICGDGQTEGCMVYNYSRRKKRDLHGSHGTVTAVNVSQEALSHRSYNLEYFVISDINGTIIDDGSH